MGRRKGKNQDHDFSESYGQRIRYLRNIGQCIIKSDPILRQLLDIVLYKYKSLTLEDYRILQDLLNHSFLAVQETIDRCRCSVHLMIKRDWNIITTTASAARRNNEPDIPYGNLRSDAIEKLRRLSNIGDQQYFILLKHICGEYFAKLLSPMPDDWDERIKWWEGKDGQGNNDQSNQPYFDNRGDDPGQSYAFQDSSDSRMAYNHQQPYQPQTSWDNQNQYQDHRRSPSPPPTRPAKRQRLSQPPSSNTSVNSNNEDYNGSAKILGSQRKCKDCSKSVLERNYETHRKSTSCQNKQKKDKAQAGTVQGVNNHAHQNGVTVYVVPPNAEMIEKPDEVKDQSAKRTVKRKRQEEKKDQAISSEENESRKSQQKESHSRKVTGDEGTSTEQTTASAGDHVRTQSEQENINVEQQPSGSSTQKERKDDEDTNLGKGASDDEKEATDTINATESDIEEGEVD